MADAAGMRPFQAVSVPQNQGERREQAAYHKQSYQRGFPCSYGTQGH